MWSWGKYSLSRRCRGVVELTGGYCFSADRMTWVAFWGRFTRLFFTFASKAISQRRLTLYLGCAVTFLLSLSVTNYISLYPSIYRICYFSDIHSLKRVYNSKFVDYKYYLFVFLLSLVRSSFIVTFIAGVIRSFSNCKQSIYRSISPYKLFPNLNICIIPFCCLQP